MCEAQPDLPDDVDRIWLESAVATDEPCPFSFRWCNEQTVERIVAVQRQFIHYIDVLELHRQNSQIIGRLLSPDHLIERDAPEAQGLAADEQGRILIWLGSPAADPLLTAPSIRDTCGKL
jgi:hypothetical protein